EGREKSPAVLTFEAQDRVEETASKVGKGEKTGHIPKPRSQSMGPLKDLSRRPITTSRLHPWWRILLIGPGENTRKKVEKCVLCAAVQHLVEWDTLKDFCSPL